MNSTSMLVSPDQAHKRISALWRELRPFLEAGQRFVISIKPETRNSAQNAALHAWIGEIAKSLTLAGQRHDAEVWKRALVAAWSRARGESVLVIPAIDGQGVDLVPRRTSQLTKAECADLLEFVIAYAITNGVACNEPAAA